MMEALFRRRLAALEKELAKHTPRLDPAQKRVLDVEELITAEMHDHQLYNSEAQMSDRLKFLLNKAAEEREEVQTIEELIDRTKAQIQETKVSHNP